MNERQKRILQFAANFLLSNLDEEGPYIFNQDAQDGAPSEDEVRAAFTAAGIEIE